MTKLNQIQKLVQDKLNTTSSTEVQKLCSDRLEVIKEPLANKLVEWRDVTDAKVSLTYICQDEQERVFHDSHLGRHYQTNFQGMSPLDWCEDYAQSKRFKKQ